MEINIPELSLVMLVGISGSGKSTFASRHFKPTEILSSDACRAMVSDDENDQTATQEAFDLLHFWAAKRLKRGLLTVVDATNIQPESRTSLLNLARDYHVLPVAIVLDLPPKVCIERNANRSDRQFGSFVIQKQHQQLRRSVRNLKEEGFRGIFFLRSPEEVESVTEIRREKLYSNKKEDTGPFDIIGDIHGCFDELGELLTQLGYQITRVPETSSNFGFEVVNPPGRKAIFLGDLTDRGPDSPGVLRLVMSMVKSGSAYWVPGNHDQKLQKYLAGKQVQLKHGLELTAKQLENEPASFKKAVERFIYDLVSHYVLDGGRLVVSHAGILEEMQGRGSGAVRSFCLYGETTGEIDEFGLPIRHNWANEYRGQAMVVYGHTPVPHAEWLNRTINIDTGCVFGGRLTALRYPEQELVAVAAKETYYEPVRPIGYFLPSKTAQQDHDDVLHIEDVTGKRIIQTRLRNNLTIREDESIAALEIMSRFAIDPRWLIYLPPTMSPCATSSLPEFLEYPTEAFAYYRSRQIDKVVCEEKHMGSRAVLVVCKDTETAISRFGAVENQLGVCYTRTGRPFFGQPELEHAFLERVNACLTQTGFWDKFDTRWVCLDCELMPWSAKAQALVKDQYAAVGAAATAALPFAEGALSQAAERGLPEAAAMLARIQTKRSAVDHYVQAYRQYCWPVNSLADYKLAPFHLLATEGQVHTDKNHEWHMEQLAEICAGDPNFFMATPYKVVDLNDTDSEEMAIRWWLSLTGKGGEGMVVKPYDFVSFQKHDLVQPAIKCRGKEYLRIIYGPEYDLPGNLERLKKRGLSHKQSLAIREFALGLEGLERFVAKEPLRRVHECVFGVLALESEAVDPRL